MIAVTLLHRKGYFRQKLDATGWQTEEPIEWAIESYLEEIPKKTFVTIKGRTSTSARRSNPVLNVIGGRN